MTRDLESLNQAGLVRFCASREQVEHWHKTSIHDARKREEKSKPSAVREGPIEGASQIAEQQTDQNGKPAKRVSLDDVLPLPASERVAELDALAARIGQEIP